MGAGLSTGEACLPCRLNADLPDLPLRERIFVDGAWRVAHSFDSGLPGWLVLVARRHVESLGQLSAEEAAALGPLLRAGTLALQGVLGCSKTYVMLFAEAEGFSHLHLHLVPRMAVVADDRRGPRAMAHLSEEPVPEPERDVLAQRLAAAWPPPAPLVPGADPSA